MADSPLEIARSSIEESASLTREMLDEAMLADVVAAADTIATALLSGNTLLLFGNGGSAADATHIAAEFLGRFLLARAPVPAISLSDNTSAVTAIGNDYGYELVFSRQVAGYGRAGDVAFGLSTSGNSANVVAGLRTAREQGLATIALTGAAHGPVGDAADTCIAIPSRSTPRIQECHMLVAHVLCDLVERRLP